MRGLRKYLTPFAPDQSGAVSVLYELGGIVVICDAGGCTGNICGFDEPRWQGRRSAVFSAGLRDMDAIMGRDDKLVDELADAAAKVDAEFCAIVGTPVPAVIGTDYRALRRMAERRCGLPCITVDTNGMELYDQGAAKAYRALMDRFATEAHPVEPGRVGVLGANPLDLSATSAEALLRAVPGAVCYGMGSGLDDVRRASAAEKNLVVAPSGLGAARLLKERFGTPYEVGCPLDALLPAHAAPSDAAARSSAAQRGLSEHGVSLGAALGDGTFAGARVLVVHQQVAANSIREELERRGASEVRCATWFMLEDELARTGDVRLFEEDDFAELVFGGGFDVLVGDPVLWRIVGDFVGTTVDVSQFAVSGKLGDRA